MKHSHPVLASRTPLEPAGIPFAAHDSFPGLHGIVVGARGFPVWTVPALQLDGRKIPGTLAIARELDRIAPGAGPFPDDPGGWSPADAAQVRQDPVRPPALFDHVARCWTAARSAAMPRLRPIFRS